MAKSGGRLPIGAALAAALLIASAGPTAAQFFDIFFPDEPPQISSHSEHERAARAHRRDRDDDRAVRHHQSHRESERESDREQRREAKRHKHEEARDRGPPVGPFTVVVAIGPQEALLYGQNGLIDRASISTGMPGHPTPMGVFSVISKARWHASNIYSGAPMPFMQRITWSGVALHAGPRPGYPASHGCIRLPEDFAVRLFHTTKVGTRVIVTREAVAPVAIASARLFVPKVAEAKPVTLAAADPAPTAVSLAAKTSAGSSAAPPAAVPAVAMAPDTTGTTGTIAAPPTDPAPAGEPPRPAGPISVFVSRKQGKVFVRQGFTELFDMPVAIGEPERPFGTHVFTAMAAEDGGKAMRWTVISIPSDFRRHHDEARKRRRGAETEPDAPPAATAAEALDRITLPPEAIERISALLVPGSSLIVSDNALSDETDDSTDFIVLTP